MIHYNEAITNTKGDALIGYFVRLADTSDDSGITLSADSNSTPIVSVSGLADAAKVDTDGMVSFWVDPGTYHLDVYATDGSTLVRRETFIQFGVPDADYGDVTVAGPAWTVDAVSGTAPTTVGLAVLGAASQAAARTAIGAGVGDLAVHVDTYAAGDGATDDTAAITTAIGVAQAANARLRFADKTYIVSSITIPSNVVIETAGFATRIKQNPGTAANTRLIKITGSNVRLGDLSVEGQLGQAGDTTGEQNHGIFIALEPGSTASISNVTIGNVKGTNIRGDAVYIGSDPTAYAAGFRVSDISVGKVIGSNVWRNICSVTGGTNISIESVTGTQVGQFAFDAEPDVGSGPVAGLRVGYIKGRCAQLAGSSATDYIGAWVGAMDLDPAYTTTSSPDYGVAAFHNGLTYRNCKSLRVERFYANGHYAQAILSISGALARQELSFGNVEIPTGCTTEATNACYIQLDSTTFTTIDTLVATTTAAVTNQAVFTSSYNIVVTDAQISLAPGTIYMRSCTDCSTLNVNITRASGNGGTVDLSGLRNRYSGGTILCDTHYAFCTKCATIGADVTAATSYNNAGTNNVFFVSTIGGAFTHLYNSGFGNIVTDVAGLIGASLTLGGGTPLTKAVAYTPTLTPTSVAAATVAEQTFTVTGLTTADKVIVNPPAIANATGIVGARVSAANTLAIRFTNPTAGALTPTSGVYTVLALRS